MLRSALALCALLVTLFVPSTLSAAPIAATPPATANALIVFPLSLTKLQDLDFGQMTVTTAGTAVIDPNANTITKTGGVLLVGTGWHAAQFVGSSAGQSSVVNIKLPNQPTTLTRQGGTETMTVSNLTLEGLSKRTVAAAASFTFRVGGTLNVGANQVEGIYTGTFSVDIQYP